MTYRRLLSVMLFALAAVPPWAQAQQASKVYRVAIVFSTSPASELVGPEPAQPLARAFLQGMRRLGYVEGQNVILERRSAEGKFERFPEIFRELVAGKVDVIVTVSNALTRAAKVVTQTVPIVMVAGLNPVEAGLVDSLARPGGNVTGLAADAGPELPGKRLQLMTELIPRLSRVALLISEDSTDRGQKDIAQSAASKLGLKLLHVKHTPTQYGEAFVIIARERPSGLLVGQSAANFANRQLIVEFAAKAGIPAMYANREFAEIGGLISYGADVASLCRDAARYVDRILKGERPASLPIERPTKFELVINLKTAKSLRLTVPQSLLLQADQIIE